ncbi:hypothetical protein GQ54DRAFT_298954 [Martensiomyces pterosporus]|nr:hypothetical protein GQ54DRAFT_298954 [Martensiomyces pterosporus]
MILRRSKSVVSTISRAEWPMPPTTVPPMPKWVSSLQPPPSPPRAEERPSRHAMASDSWLGVSSTRTVDGNPSLDAVGRRFNDTGSIREGHGGSSASSPFARFPWFKQRGSAPR